MNARIVPALLLPVALLAGCSGTATTLNAGTWIRLLEPVGYCIGDDGGGTAYLQVRRLAAYPLPGLVPPRGPEPGDARLHFRAADVAAAVAAAPDGWRWQEQLADGALQTRQRVQVRAGEAPGDWRLELPAAASPAPACAPDAPGRRTDGIPYRQDGTALLVLPDIVPAPALQRATAWWHWPALVLVPLGAMLDVMTAPLQAGAFLYFLNQINRGSPPAIEVALLIGALAVATLAWNWLLWRLARGAWRRLRAPRH